MLPTDAAQELRKEYDDDAHEILSMWSALKEQLDNFDQNVEDLKELQSRDLTEQRRIVDNYNAETATEEETTAFAKALAELNAVTESMAVLYADIAVKEYLSSIEYKDGTLADFFSMKYRNVSREITLLYPLVASLTEGQRAGLQFVTLSDLVMFAYPDSEGYKDAAFDALEEVSIYEGVDRNIYKKGGVALTSDALRANASAELAGDGSQFSTLTFIMTCVTGLSVIAFLTPFIGLFVARSQAADLGVSNLMVVQDNFVNNTTTYQRKVPKIKGLADEFEGEVIKIEKEQNDTGFRTRIVERNAVSAKLAIGLGVIMVVAAAVTLYMAYSDMVAYYKVDYTPIPHYMVDEKDITAYNAKGEKIVIKNQAAYYKAVDCNRAENDEWFDILGVSADLNGTVGRQWLALYAAKNENMAPILAASLKAVVGSTNVPSGYKTGIHMFGSSAGYNLNNTQLVWNNQAKSVFVYFKAEEGAAGGSASGSVMTAGSLVLTGIAGLAVGVLGVVCVTAITKKKRAK